MSTVLDMHWRTRPRPYAHTIRRGSQYRDCQESSAIVLSLHIYLSPPIFVQGKTLILPQSSYVHNFTLKRHPTGGRSTVLMSVYEESDVSRGKQYCVCPQLWTWRPLCWVDSVHRTCWRVMRLRSCLTLDRVITLFHVFPFVSSLRVILKLSLVSRRPLTWCQSNSELLRWSQF